jgi:hypothetical protein
VITVTEFDIPASPKSEFRETRVSKNPNKGCLLRVRLNADRQSANNQLAFCRTMFISTKVGQRWRGQGAGDKQHVRSSSTELFHRFLYVDARQTGLDRDKGKFKKRDNIL